jgi:tetratricopeptide (TPR) repeat protein
VGAYDTAVADFTTLLSRGIRLERADSLVHIPLNTNDCRYVLALFQYRARRFQDAIDLYKEALANDIGLFMAHVQMGRIYEEYQMWPEAVDQFQRAVAVSPDDPSLLLDLGVVLREARRFGEAETILGQAMDANPRDARVPYHLGITLQDAGKLAEARTAFTRFLSLAPSRYDRQIRDTQQRLAALP